MIKLPFITYLFLPTPTPPTLSATLLLYPTIATPTFVAVVATSRHCPHRCPLLLLLPSPYHHHQHHKKPNTQNHPNIFNKISC